ncbi:MAG: type II toxin-antitoxin system VapC family toxin [Acidobacteria bacterium]|nr:type II toxin-antitoxin system VapC family toxin [Acidobacteriota bacterium]
MILDTNAISALADGDPSVGELLEQATVVALPVVALGEYRYGIQQSRHHARYEAWLEELVQNVTVLEIGSETAKRYSSLRMKLKNKGHPIPANDLWIAALAEQFAMPVLSQDKHFDVVPGVRRIGWE